MRMLPLLVLLATGGLAGRPTVELIKSAMDIAFHPIKASEQLRNQEIMLQHNLPARHDDLASTRLHIKTRDVVEKIWETLNDPQRFAIVKEKGVEKEVLKMFQLVQSDVFAMSSYVSRTNVVQDLKTVSMSSSSSSETARQWRVVWDMIQTLTGKVSLYYSHLDGFMTAATTARQQSRVTRLAMEDFAKSIIQPGSTGDSAIGKTLSQLNKLVVPSPPKFQQNETTTTNYAAFHRLHYVLMDEDGANICNLGQSPHQLIYNLYNHIALTEIKGYAMIQFSYMMLKLYGKGNFTTESELARKTFEREATEKLLAAKSILPHVERTVWKCDSKNPSEGSTYVQLTKLLQGHIENEVDMNDISTCRHSCSVYDVAEPKSCFKNLFCAKQARCNGRLFDCQFHHADAWVCMSSEPHRKYDWIEYEDGRILGTKNDQCDNKIKVDSWWRWVFYHCSYCLCKCDAPGPQSDRFWSLKQATSNIKKNFIVTGVRLVKKGRMIHPEIEQARALPEGSVDEISRVWLEARDVPITDDTEVDPRNTEYMTMSYEQRAIDLDRLDAPPGYVITGIRLRNLGGHLNLEARVTPMKFKEGKLLSDQSVWISNDNTPATLNKRVQIRILSPDVPTKFKGHSVIDSDTNQYIQFDTTASEKDVMQTTVPFVDVQSVAPSTGTWLAGVGLYHKGSTGYGGYVGLLVSTFDFTKHMLPDHSEGANDVSAMTQELKYDFKS